jgi:hypothetical protein
MVRWKLNPNILKQGSKKDTNMKRSLTIAGAMIILACPALADEHRQLGPHQHGHGKLNIAIENGEVSMDLDVPGADIVGFEHEPSTPEQKAAFEAGKAKLADALSIFKMPAAAGCTVKEAKVSIEGEHEEDTPKGATASAHEAEEEHHHSDFNVDYKLQCQSVAKLTAIDFDYFKAFAGARVLEVTIITPKGQNSYEVTRDKLSLDLTGVM